ncbi:MAG: acyl-CoA dehydrogenase family protein [Parvibaculaceae bacterium]
MTSDHIDAAGDLVEFRERIRAFLIEALPRRLAETPRAGLAMPVPMLLEWQAILYQHGLGAPAWPKKIGGLGWSPRQMHVWYDECAKARAPRHVLQTISMIAPILINFGDAEQQSRHLPGIISGDVMWCQGYSEPGSGSDLASLKTSAQRQGNRYIVNGQKIWTTYAHEADWIFALVRTDPDAIAQRGISFLLIDMKSPGIEIRPIISIDGLHHLNEVFFNNVEVPVGNRIGEENKGWDYAKSLLNHERLGICDPTELRARMECLSIFMRSDEGQIFLGTSANDIARKLATLEIGISSLDASYLRILQQIENGIGPGPGAAALKYLDTELTQSLNEIALEMAGEYATADQSPAFAPDSKYRAVGPSQLSLAYMGYAFSRSNSIAGGTDEVQKNIVWRALSA